jgi:hypothetical protein
MEMDRNFYAGGEGGSLKLQNSNLKIQRSFNFQLSRLKGVGGIGRVKRVLLFQNFQDVLWKIGAFD